MMGRFSIRIEQVSEDDLIRVQVTVDKGGEVLGHFAYSL